MEICKEIMNVQNYNCLVPCQNVIGYKGKNKSSFITKQTNKQANNNKKTTGGFTLMKQSK